METVNGQWFMKCCDTSDPACMKSQDDLLTLIRELGFLPLFSNDIAGFSVEEHTSAEAWWTGDPGTDPWEWRISLARHPEIAYGKFFDKKAGFIHKDIFPVFANYRRNGYDFDALFDEGMVSHRAKRIMDVIGLSDESVRREVMTYELKEQAQFGKDGGEENFDGTLASLQMQAYLIMSDFRQRRNKRGQPYGWHIAAIEAPEAKWGYEFVTSAYNESPDVSWEKISGKMNLRFPSADANAIQKVLGIPYPDKATGQKVAAKPSSTVVWPESLLKEIGDLPLQLSVDQLEGLRYAISTLKKNEQAVIKLRYVEGKQWDEIADELNRSKGRLLQVRKRAVSKLKHPSRIRFIRKGQRGAIEEENSLKVRCRNAGTLEEQIQILNGISLYECALSVATAYRLIQAGYPSLGHIAKALDDDPLCLTRMQNSWDLSWREVIPILLEYGVNCSKVDETYEKQPKSILSLDLSHQLYLILLKADLDTVEKLEKLILTDPDRLLRLRGLGEKRRSELFTKLKGIGIDISLIEKTAG